MLLPCLLVPESGGFVAKWRAPLALASGTLNMVVFRNHNAAYLWGFMAVFMMFIAAMSYVLLRDGPPPGYSEAMLAALMVMFWIGGLTASARAATRPCITVTLRPDATLRIVRRYPFKRSVLSVHNSEIERAQVIESRDDDGDPYFFSRVELSDGSKLDLFECHDRQTCESVCARFNQAVSAANASGAAR